MKPIKAIRNLYCFPGFRTRATLVPHPEDLDGYIVRLERRQKKRSVPDAVKQHLLSGTAESIVSEISMRQQRISILTSSTVALPVHGVRV